MGFCIVTTEAGAGCPSGFDPFAICDFEGRDTTVYLCSNENTVTYSYSAFGEDPELILYETIKDIDYIPWDGPGALSGSVTFRNGDYAYEVASVFEADPFDGAPHAVNRSG